MFVGDIGVGALDAAGEVRADEQVEDAVHAVGRDRLPRAALTRSAMS
jgi:hypothetical protein